MERIHNTKKRMPVIVDKSHETSWLDDSNSAQEALAHVVGSGSASLSAHTIRMDFFKLGGMADEITENVTYPELVLYD